MKNLFLKLLSHKQAGLVLVNLVLCVLLAAFAGTHLDPKTGALVNNFLNPYTLMQTVTDTSFFAVMAVGMTLVIISGGIDLSVGSIYALSGVLTALFVEGIGAGDPWSTVLFSAMLCLGLGLACGLLNGIMVVGLGVHPFVITLGTMWIFRGIAFVVSEAKSILVSPSLTAAVKYSFALGSSLYPVPFVIMLIVSALGVVYLSRTAMGRRIYAVGGNVEASRYAGLNISRVLIGVYVISGLLAGLAALVGSAYYGSASCADATGYELYVIAAAVVGGASLSGGRGRAGGAVLGALLIVLIRQSIRTLHFDQNYEWIIIGCAIIIAVVLDRASARLTRGKV